MVLNFQTDTPKGKKSGMKKVITHREKKKYYVTKTIVRKGRKEKVYLDNMLPKFVTSKSIENLGNFFLTVSGD